MTKIDDHLGLDDRIATQRRFWRFERIGWVVLTVFVFLGLAGLFSRGPLSDARYEGKTFSIDYERFSRQGLVARMTIHVPGDVAARHPSIRLGHDLIEAYELETLQPEPESTATDSRGVTLHFAPPPSGEPLTIHIFLHAEQAGLVEASIAVADEEARFTQFIYP